LPDPQGHRDFEQTVLPHLDAAYNLARWLTRNDQDAEDVVQEACLRALKFYSGFQGGDGRAWLLAIVRNTGYTWLQKHRVREQALPLEETHDLIPDGGCGPEELALRSVDKEILRQAVEALPIENREVIVLRELEGLSYKEIATIADLPIGTVMSRLARGRQRLQRDLAARMNEEV